MPKKKLTGRGGAGRGQGKKPGRMGVKGTKSLGLSPDILEFLTSLTPTDEQPDLPGASKFTEELIRKSRAFKSWQSAKTT